jgi:hypothetical protein
MLAAAVAVLSFLVRQEPEELAVAVTEMAAVVLLEQEPLVAQILVGVVVV